MDVIDDDYESIPSQIFKSKAVLYIVNVAVLV